MFTGLIEEIGVVTAVRRVAGGLRITVGAPRVTEDLRVGDSVAVSGACLTATAVGGGAFVADVVTETERRTTLPRMRAAGRVNLELALRADSRLGGHLVAGHVDAVGQVLSRTRTASALVLEIAAPSDLTPFIVEKGSVAVDGASLTVMDVSDTRFRVSVIPHTARVTTVGDLTPGAEVNLEVDMIAKYIARMLEPHVAPVKRGHGLTEETLRRLGF